MRIPYTRQWIDKSDIEEVVKALQSDWITQGPKVDEFEERVADYCGVRYAAAFSSATAALHGACSAIGLGQGDEALTSPVTFVATANCAVYQGARPLFCDVQPDTANIDPEEIKRRITKKTRAIISIDLAGHPCDYNEIVGLARRYGLWLIQDACHSLGAVYRGRKIGPFSDITVFGFHPTKVITTGEGGMAVTNNKSLYEKLKLFRSHGITRDRNRFSRKGQGDWYYEMRTLGYNYRLSDIHSSLGISQLGRLNEFIKLRRKIVERYNRAFSDIGEVRLPQERPYVKSAWHLYVIRLKTKTFVLNKRRIFDLLRKKGIGVNVHYIPVHMQPYYQKTFGYKPGDFPLAQRYYKEALTLPLFPKMGDAEVNRVIDIFKKTIKKFL